jgi:UDP-3-O-[3-hydroxymyristoyl] glucosamine N-acyltransferase
MLCSMTGLAGSTVVGKNVILAGAVGVAGHCEIGDNVVVTARSGVPGDLEANGVYSGYPAIENRQWLRCVAVFNKLPELQKAIRELQKAKQ